MNCPKCGAEMLIEEAAFCEECGAKLGGGGAQPEPTLLEDDDAGAASAERVNGSAAETGGDTLRERGHGPAAETGGDTLRAEQNRMAPRSPSPGDGPPPIDTRKASPPRGEAHSRRVPTSPCAADKSPCGERCPVRLEFNVAKVYVEGRKGVVEFRVVNSLARSLDTVKVVLKHDYIERMHKTRVAKQLAPGDENRTLRAQLDLPGDSGGEVLIDFELRVEDRAAPAVYCNDHSIFVLPPSAPAQQVVMNLNAPEIHASEKGMMGAYADASMHVNAVIEGREIETVDELFRSSAYIEAAWHPVRLYLDDAKTNELKRMLEEPSGRDAKAVSARAPSGPASTRLRLDMQGPFGARRLMVLSKREVTFGKSRRGADICTLVLPLSRENTKLSRRISGRFDKDTGERTSHMALRLASSGLEVLDHSRNGTFVDGKMVSKGTRAPLGAEAKLTLAEVLDLGVRAVATGHEFDPADYASLARGGLFDEGMSSRVAAASIERVSNFPDESYLVIYSGAVLGSSRDAAVSLAGADLAPKHLLLMHLGDGFYIENVSGRAEGARLNGSALVPDSLEPIRPGDTIRAGGVEISVGEFEQLRPEA